MESKAGEFRMESAQGLDKVDTSRMEMALGHCMGQCHQSGTAKHPSYAVVVDGIIFIVDVIYHGVWCVL